MNPDELIPTRRSLLTRLKDWDGQSIQITNADGTREFVDDTAINAPVRFYRFIRFILTP